MHKERVLARNPSFGMYCGGIVNWRVAIVHYVAKVVGLHVKLEGFPLGTSRNLERGHVFGSDMATGAFKASH